MEVQPMHEIYIKPKHTQDRQVKKMESEHIYQENEKKSEQESVKIDKYEVPETDNKPKATSSLYDENENDFESNIKHIQDKKTDSEQYESMPEGGINRMDKHEILEKDYESNAIHAENENDMDDDVESHTEFDHEKKIELEQIHQDYENRPEDYINKYEYDYESKSAPREYDQDYNDEDISPLLGYGHEKKIKSEQNHQDHATRSEQEIIKIDKYEVPETDNKPKATTTIYDENENDFESNIKHIHDKEIDSVQYESIPEEEIDRIDKHKILDRDHESNAIHAEYENNMDDDVESHTKFDHEKKMELEQIHQDYENRDSESNSAPREYDQDYNDEDVNPSLGYEHEKKIKSEQNHQDHATRLEVEVNKIDKYEVSDKDKDSYTSPIVYDKDDISQSSLESDDETDKNDYIDYSYAEIATHKKPSVNAVNVNDSLNNHDDFTSAEQNIENYEEESDYGINKSDNERDEVKIQHTDERQKEQSSKEFGES